MFLRNGLEPWHLLVVALVALLVFGSKRLPDTARSLGKSLRILKSETRAMKQEDAGRPGPVRSSADEFSSPEEKPPSAGTPPDAGRAADAGAPPAARG
ncbi:Sec-independent protein translocase subunit TatA [Streptomyces tubbatahanensis]|uniref:Sec-independent protein translocase protein TatA n=1 Tax=Streptomyces tubbatahanensis TaxID=2923272 RepID=A0ABY3XMA2_9ACTN|nr:Sec-independent protein translocase subunit TatA [Streptomyces tubbatahanensis]UNS95535.1 Sec-independent protein translocase subunit TatA [Streptomyces tubbatahanensis]